MRIDLDQRMIQFSESLWIGFEEILDSIQTMDEDIVYIGGSLVEGQLNPLSSGMGNIFSDVDVFIIREHSDFLKTDCVYDNNVRKAFFREIKQRGFDIEVYDKAFVIALMEALERIQLDPQERIYNIFSKYLPKECNFELLNTFLCRLYNSICIKGKGPYRELRNNIRYRKFLDLMANNTIVSVDNIYDDVQGNIEAGQLDVALYCARRIVLNVMFVVLMKEGIFTDREKWIPLKFQNLCLAKDTFTELYEAYRNLFRGELFHDGKCKKVIVEAMSVSKQIIETVLMEELQL